ncbi:MAG: hypothetical protein ACFCU9_05895 [Cyanophyceae cyanobacterium]
MNSYFALKLFLRAQMALLLPFLMVSANAATMSDSTESLRGSSLSIQVTELEPENNAPVLVADSDDDDDDDDDNDDDDNDYDLDDDDDDDDDDDRDYDTSIQRLQWRQML